MEKATERIADHFQCRYTVFEKGTDPALVEQAYRAALEAGKTGGFYPAVFVADEYAVEWLEDIAGPDLNRDEIIASCKDNGEEILKQRFEGYMEDFREDLDEQALKDFIGNETEGEELRHFIGYISFPTECWTRIRCFWKSRSKIPGRSSGICLWVDGTNARHRKK